MRMSRLAAVLTIATIASATQGWAASGGTGSGFGAGSGGAFSAGMGAVSIGGLSISHSNSFGSSPSPFTRNIGTPSFGTSRSMTDIGQSRAFSGSLSDMTAIATAAIAPPDRVISEAAACQAPPSERSIPTWI